MASAEKRENGRHRGTWRDQAGRQQHTKATFISYTAALEYAKEQEDLARLGIDTSSAKMAWRLWEPIWAQSRSIAASTAKIDAGQLARHVEPRWGDVPLREITRFDVQVWVNKLARTLAPGTVHKIYHLLSSSLNAAAESGVLPASPCVKIALPEVVEGNERYLTVEEVAAAIEELERPYRTAVILLAGTGLRFGEMAGLHWHRVDVAGGLVEVVETWSSHAQHVTPHPKGKRRRYVGLPDWVAEELGEDPGLPSCGLRHEQARPPCRSGLVIPAPRGGALDAKNMLQRHWYPALDRAGVARARQHDLRHTFASWLAQDGVTIDILADLLGHASTRTTQRYRHIGSAHLDLTKGMIEKMDPRSRAVPRRDIKIVPKAL